MTTYYYMASDQKLADGNASLNFVETEEWLIPGFAYPVQREIVNGVEKKWELRELLQYIQNNTAPHDVCTIQIAHLVNPIGLIVQNQSTLSLQELTDSKQLLLAEGDLLTIEKK